MSPKPSLVILIQKEKSSCRFLLTLLSLGLRESQQSTGAGHPQGSPGQGHSHGHRQGGAGGLQAALLIPLCGLGNSVRWIKI